MALGAFSLYCLYWIYRNFQATRKRTGRNLWPLPGAIFTVFFIYSCLREIADRSGHRRRAAAGLAAVFIVFSLVAHAPDPWWLMSLGVIAPVAAANGWAHQANVRAMPDYPRNDRFNAGNFVALAIGVPLGILAIMGAFYVGTDP